MEKDAEFTVFIDYNLLCFFSSILYNYQHVPIGSTPLVLCMNISAIVVRYLIIFVQTLFS